MFFGAFLIYNRSAVCLIIFVWLLKCSRGRLDKLNVGAKEVVLAEGNNVTSGHRTALMSVAAARNMEAEKMI